MSSSSSPDGLKMRVTVQEYSHRVGSVSLIRRVDGGKGRYIPRRLSARAWIRERGLYIARFCL